MAAIGTQAVRKNLINLLVSDVNAGNDKYYIGIGKSDTFNATDTPTTPVNTLREEMIARSNLQSIKLVADCTTVVERYNWARGGIYTAFSDTVDNIPEANPYYVVTEDNEIYLCLQQGKDLNGITVTSTVKPSYTDAGVAANQAFETSDGYRWKFMYSITAVRSFAFQSAGFIPISKVDWSSPGDSSGLNAFQLQQLSVQRAAVPGQIIGVKINNAGSTYTGSPQVVFDGPGSNAAATITLGSNGQIAKVEMNNESAALGSGYYHASARIIDSEGNGVGAELQPIIGPVDGIGANVLDDLHCGSIMFTIKPDGDESETFITTNDFRQISLIKNPEEVDSNGVITSSTGKALKYMRLKDTPAAGGFTRDRLIRGVSSNAGAYITDIDDSNIYYHQNEQTGFGQFVPGEIIDESDGTGRGTIDSAAGNASLRSLVDAFSGEMLYIENRAAVTRTANQQEDIKVIITL